MNPSEGRPLAAKPVASSQAKKDVATKAVTGDVPKPSTQQTANQRLQQIERPVVQNPASVQHHEDHDESVQETGIGYNTGKNLDAKAGGHLAEQQAVLARNSLNPNIAIAFQQLRAKNETIKAGHVDPGKALEALDAGRDPKIVHANGQGLGQGD